MSSGHGGDLAGVTIEDVRALLQNARVLSELRMDRRIDGSWDIPYLGGYSVDGRVIYFDRHLPQEIFVRQGDGGGYIQPRRFLILHETFEKTLIDVLGWAYDIAHGAATIYEHSGVQQAGINPARYETALKPFIKADEHESVRRVPPDLDLTPYSGRLKEYVKWVMLNPR